MRFWGGRIRHNVSMGVAIYDLLGGETVLGPAPQSSLDWIAFTRSGLPVQAAAALGKHFSYSLDGPVFARSGSQLRLTPAESDYLVRTATVLSRAIDVLESEEQASRWLSAPNVALGGAIPASLLDTSTGEHAVLELLDRIEYGVYS